MEEHKNEFDYCKFSNTKEDVSRSIVPEEKNMP